MSCTRRCIPLRITLFHSMSADAASPLEVLDFGP